MFSCPKYSNEIIRPTVIEMRMREIWFWRAPDNGWIAPKWWQTCWMSQLDFGERSNKVFQLRRLQFLILFQQWVERKWRKYQSIRKYKNFHIKTDDVQYFETLNILSKIKFLNKCNIVAKILFLFCLVALKRAGWVVCMWLADEST